jgi:uncharacterized protein (DUF1330 family)
MSVYVVVEFNPKDSEKLQAYSADAAAIITKYQGEFLVKGQPQQLCGESNYKMQAIIAFPTRELAETWYNSPEYQALIPLRDQGMDAHFQLNG